MKKAIKFGKYRSLRQAKLAGVSSEKFKLEIKARNVYQQIVHRCRKAYHPSYKYYGARGIECRVEREEFIEWYKHEVKGFENPSVDRINPKGHYEFGNIRILDRGENSRRSALGRKRPNLAEYNKRRSKKVFYKGHVYPSICEAARAHGITDSAIRIYLKRGYPYVRLI